MTPHQTTSVLVVLSILIIVTYSQTFSPFPDGSEVIVFDEEENPLPQCSFNYREGDDGRMGYVLEDCNKLSLAVRKLLAKEWHSVGTVNFYGRRSNFLDRIYTGQCNAVYSKGIVIVPHHCIRPWILHDLRIFWSSLHRSSDSESWRSFQNNDTRNYQELELMPLFQQSKKRKSQ